MWQWIIGIIILLSVLNAFNDIGKTNSAVQQIQSDVEDIQSNQSSMQTSIQTLVSPSPMQLQCTPDVSVSDQLDCTQQPSD